ncbi:sigma-70 family RNA polymerase sigma factor [Clostridium beijerinckii]|uniref:sigma-70 family RNA polymerase sigma factor n=1 Tax=Clostridium beijerinckii TaxID=1520 RepID=UPI00098BE351|nr:sigma-70 family RNA polymerase sigma factor [Clostridium beijerinckii]NRT78649.1 RNA polymerase sigma factor (sigma-70 family) [Clostridium beijerinckii]OOM41373.1 RNA polymerase sigma factor SigA [Clostridium beijerinckii]
MSNEELVLLYQQGDKQALESLIKANSGMIKKLANKFNGINKMIEFDDLVQAGIIGLINAASKYNNDLENKASFITYAFQYIKREIFSCVNGRSEKEISNNKLYNSCISLDVPLQADEYIQLKDTIESIDDGFENVEEKIYIKQLREELEDAMLDNNTLKEREILHLCYGWDYQKTFTYKEVAETLNISINSIPQIEFNALRKLRNSTWGKDKYKECIGSKLESIMEGSRYDQDKAISAIDIVNKYFSGVI